MSIYLYLFLLFSSLGRIFTCFGDLQKSLAAALEVWTTHPGMEGGKTEGKLGAWSARYCSWTPLCKILDLLLNTGKWTQWPRKLLPVLCSTLHIEYFTQSDPDTFFLYNNPRDHIKIAYFTYFSSYNKFLFITALTPTSSLENAIM